MPVIRNLFKRNPSVQTEQKPADSTQTPDAAVPQTETKTPAISILSHRDDEANSYQLCVVNGSGEYLPPSPPEKKAFWKRSSSSSSVRREVREALRAADNDAGFAISRESFECYRRSFDISARSPVIDPQRPSLESRPSRSSLDRPSRASLDLLTPTSPLRQSFDSRASSHSRLPPPAVAESASEDENEFKDVDLNDNAPHPKKRGFLARFGGGEHHSHSHPSAPTEHQDCKARPRSSTMNWKKDLHEGSEELGSFQPDTANQK